jgi:hypothetical protein
MLAAAERAKEVRATLELVPNDPPEGAGRLPSERVPTPQERQAIEALSYRMAGLSYDQIAERMGVAVDTVSKLVERNLTRARNTIAEPMRDLENSRLDRVQAAIWPDALKGDPTAVGLFLQISARRARMNGLDAPKQIALSANVRVEMQQALADLRSVVLGEVVSEALDERDDPSDTDD